MLSWLLGMTGTATKGQFLLWSFLTGDLSSCQPQRLGLVFQSSLEALSQWVLGLVHKWFRIYFGSFFYVFQFHFFFFFEYAVCNDFCSSLIASGSSGLSDCWPDKRLLVWEDCFCTLGLQRNVLLDLVWWNTLQFDMFGLILTDYSHVKLM